MKTQKFNIYWSIDFWAYSFFQEKIIGNNTIGFLCLGMLPQEKWYDKNRKPVLASSGDKTGIFICAALVRLGDNSPHTRQYITIAY